MLNFSAISFERVIEKQALQNAIIHPRTEYVQIHTLCGISSITRVVFFQFKFLLGERKKRAIIHRAVFFAIFLDLMGLGLLSVEKIRRTFFWCFWWTCCHKLPRSRARIWGDICIQGGTLYNLTHRWAQAAFLITAPQHYSIALMSAFKDFQLCSHLMFSGLL